MPTVEPPSAERKSAISQALSEVGAAVRRSQHKDGAFAEARLVAVSKYKPASDILAAYDAGQRHFGENYVQELCDKAAVLPADIEWHFIGRLQSNKCKALAAIPNLWAVETIESAEKAHKLNAAWHGACNQRPLNVFVQVNTSGEANKGGIEPHQVEDVVQDILNSCPALHLQGLMTIGSIAGSQQRPNPDFCTLAELRNGLRQKIGVELELSMGMSDDFEHALELGATSVRVGSRIFGTRPQKESIAPAAP
ncbi:hypothetical protein H4R20_003245 [Coemansia guatemalensis]|uniref:Pyridoxal phosphate homeostasis protein n=1 Tax=Coemansia guatemalensis TaxID=2761395 RepID=A0A9W8HZZ9_9FUNG|nr:hypothetical protein H4R20_003245 [Coemansia guatemalensis]